MTESVVNDIFSHFKGLKNKQNDRGRPEGRPVSQREN